MAAKVAEQYPKQFDFRPSKDALEEITTKNVNEHLDPILFDLLQYAHPYGHEKDVMRIIINHICKAHFDGQYVVDPKDTNQIWKAGENLIVVVGKSDILFSSHMDNTANQKTKLRLFIDEGCYVYATDTEGNERAVGADDKVGVWVMIKMIQNGIGGNYVFHAGEEQGMVGSMWMAEHCEDWLSTMRIAVAFDRQGYSDIITHQYGQKTASDKFASALASELNAHIKDIMEADDEEKELLKFSLFGEEVPEYDKSDKGIATDTVNYLDIISECTNVSVGYFGRHTYKECFNSFWLRGYFLPIILNVNWGALPSVRDPKAAIRESLPDKTAEVIDITSYQVLDKDNRDKDVWDGDDIPFNLSSPTGPHSKFNSKIPGKVEPHQVTPDLKLSQIPDIPLPLNTETAGGTKRACIALNMKLLERLMLLCRGNPPQPTYVMAKQVFDIQQDNTTLRHVRNAMRRQIEELKQGSSDLAPAWMINRIEDDEALRNDLDRERKKVEELEATIGHYDNIMFPNMDEAYKKLETENKMLIDKVKLLDHELDDAGFSRKLLEENENLKKEIEALKAETLKRLRRI